MNAGSSIVDRVQDREQRNDRLISMTKETRRIETTSRKYKSYKSILESIVLRNPVHITASD